jgi:hypothetical protein
MGRSSDGSGSKMNGLRSGLTHGLEGLRGDDLQAVTHWQDALPLG